MKIKKYYARNLQEGMHLVKKDLGMDALILSSRKVRQRGFKGFFLPRQIEIVAAIDNRVGYGSGNNGSTHLSSRHLMDEISELKELVQKVALRGAYGRGASGENESIVQWRSQLEKHDIDPTLIEELFDEVMLSLNGEVQINKEILGILLQKKIAAKLKCVEEKAFRHQIFIGPTGVGKTTTLAKVAARYALFQGEKVGLVTIDHYRIGAVEQMRTYAEIVDLPLEVVMMPDDIERTKKRLASCDRILVDTAGRSTGNTMQLSEMANLISAFTPAEIFLVLSATTRWQDIRHIAESFKPLKYNRLIITKVDETKAAGAMLNAVYVTGLPLVYITDGQNVPDDLRIASDIDITGLIAGGEE